MKTNFNVTGSERKRLVQTICKATGEKAKYLGMPSMAYEIGAFTVDKTGALEFSDSTEREPVENVYAAIDAEGFECDPAERPAFDAADEAEAAPETKGCGLVVSLPTDSLQGRAWNNLSLILSAKGDLIRKALAVESLEFKEDGDEVSFPWFEDKVLTPEEIKAYTHFISALCEMARNLKRASAKETETDNDKYTFRCFLLRLGFIGAEYKEERKILLRNLSGSSAFKGVSA